MHYNYPVFIIDGFSGTYLTRDFDSDAARESAIKKHRKEITEPGSIITASASEAITALMDSDEAFADAILTLTSDKALLKTKGEEGRKYILEWLDTNSVAERYEEMYLAAASGH